MSREPFDEEYYARAYGGSRGSYDERTTPNKWLSMCGFISSLGVTPKNGLDTGCADGAFLAHARSRFPQTMWRGCEVSRYALDRARASLPGMTLLQGSATSLPFADAELDLVTAFDVLEHVTDLPQAIRELARVLTTHGVLVVSVPVYDGPVGWLVRLLDKDPTHVHKRARRFWLRDCFGEQFELVRWLGLWRYYLGRYWHARATLGRRASPAIAMAWRRRADR